ncbi:hypothetical protein [Gilvimarinus algae]|uniref:ABC transporter permease n=1 Tax=Gilvimarinus algae TaxID=3058037 RepID=A0ABT8TBV1_9GAMM|nr:hypothetical protein [Gilvimarinus sp. SDUM040014]MDO3381426.1 hypothetical protein [Gilvimarinus sp. SDUM040014]
MNKIITQVKREVWESSGIFYKAPLLLFAIILVFSAISLYSLHAEHLGDVNFHWSNKWHSEGEQANATEGHQSVQEMAADKLIGVQYIIYFIFGVICLFNTIIYSLGALIGDRRDRSILFFKSLPLSEWQVVITKLLLCAFTLPLIYWLCAFLTVLAYSGGAVAFGTSTLDLSGSELWQQMRVLPSAAAGFVKLWFTGLWALPLISALLLVSAWAKRSPFGILVAVFVGIWLFEKWFLGTGYLVETLAAYLSGLYVGDHISFVAGDGQAGLRGIGAFVVRPGLYLGLAVSCVFVYGAVWLRDRRFEI